MDNKHEYDFIVIGSGFGGSVSAMRLSQKGYRVAVLEMGKSYQNSDFPTSSWHVRKYVWFPKLACYGIQKISWLKKILILHGTGVGGGSLVYANILMKPNNAVFESDQWPSEVNWKKELAPHYETAKKMLGVTTNPFLCSNERALQSVANTLNIEETFRSTEVGVYFGDNPRMDPQAEVADPYFHGQGPRRTPCYGCGRCMIGCPAGAKNTLDKNYLFFAQKWGTNIVPETKATKITPLSGGGYTIETEHSTAFFKKPGPSFRAKNVVLSAGVLGTMELLLKNRDKYKTLPCVSTMLGHGVRTNGECLLGVTSFDKTKDFSRGVAIGAVIQPDQYTKIEGVRYPSGSGLLRLLAVPMTGNGNALTRPLKLLINYIIHFPKFLKLLMVRDWARSTIILLVMQSKESKLQLKLGRRWWWPFKPHLQGSNDGPPVPSYIPVAQRVGQLLSDEINGIPQNIVSEVLLKTPATAHVLGGVNMGKDQSSGVVDVHHEVFGHPGLFVCDASIVPANLAINPSLTISALAERFTEQFPDVSHDHEERPNLSMP